VAGIFKTALSRLNSVSRLFTGYPNKKLPHAPVEVECQDPKKNGAGSPPLMVLSLTLEEFERKRVSLWVKRQTAVPSGRNDQGVNVAELGDHRSPAGPWIWRLEHPFVNDATFLSRS
jgi:hypothetical protein